MLFLILKKTITKIKSKIFLFEKVSIKVVFEFINKILRYVNIFHVIKKERIIKDVI